MNNQSGIYLITCKNNQRKYVGSAVNLDRRFKEHLYDLKRGVHDNSHIQACWNKYGEDCFMFSVLEVVDDVSTIYSREQFWMDALKPEFNMSASAVNSRLGVKDTKERIDRRVESRRKHWASLNEVQKQEFRNSIKKGRNKWWKSLSKEDKENHIRRISNKHSDATRKKISDKVNKAYAEDRMPERGPMDEQTKKKISDALMGHIQGPASEATREKLRIANTGKKASEETRRKLSESHKGQIVSEETKAKLSAMRKDKKHAPMSEETKEKLRQRAKEQWANPEYKAKHHKALKEVMSSPEMREKLSKGGKGKVLSEEHRAAIGNAHRGMKRSDASKKRLSKARKLWWSTRKKKK